MPTTAKGWKYPDGSAKLGEYPVKIQDLAAQLNDRILIGKVNVTINAGATFGNAVVPTAPLVGSKLEVIPIPETTSGYTCTLPAAPVATVDTTVRAHRPAGASTAAAATFPLHYIAIATD